MPDSSPIKISHRKLRHSTSDTYERYLDQERELYTSCQTAFKVLVFWGSTATILLDMKSLLPFVHGFCSFQHFTRLLVDDL